MTPDAIEWLLEHAVAAYEAEVRSTEKNRERTAVVISAALTPLAGAAAYLATSFRGEMFARANIYLFCIPWLIAVVLLLLSSACAAYGLHQKIYVRRPPSPSQIIPYFDAHPDPGSSLEDAQLGMLKEYAISIDYNFKLNEHKKWVVLWAQRLSFYAFAILVIFCVPRWAYNFANNEQEIQPVRLITPVSVQLLQEKQMSQQDADKTSPLAQQAAKQTSTQTAPTTPAVQAKVAQAKPTFPTGTMVMDSAGKTKPPFPKGNFVMEAHDENKKPGK